MAQPKKSSLPKPLPEGFVLTDGEKRKWKLGKRIGEGGFGLIYLASRDVDRAAPEDTEFVIKVEYKQNGPLFSELKFYQRAAKPESMEKWMRAKKIDFLGIPTYWGSGLAEYDGLSYRFMAMDRLGTDLQKILQANGGRLKKATVLQLGHRLVDVLEYIHENEYVHADIKPANLMLGCGNREEVYLADYGLSYRYCPDGAHKNYKENPKKCHNGTIEYTSLDAHKGLTPSRRGDLQILGFCLLHWLTGSLPWDGFLSNPAQVQDSKTVLMDNLPDSVKQMSAKGAGTDEIAAFLLYVKTLDYEDKPDYMHLRELLGCPAAGRLDFSAPEEPRWTVPEERHSGKKTAGPAKHRVAPDNGKLRPRPIAACYLRGPPLPKPKPEPMEVDAPAVARTPTPARGVSKTPVREGKPPPIPACFLRGPPLSTAPRPKQELKRSRSGRGSSETKRLRKRSDEGEPMLQDVEPGQQQQEQQQRQRQEQQQQEQGWDEWFYREAAPTRMSFLLWAGVFLLLSVCLELVLGDTAAPHKRL